MPVATATVQTGIVTHPNPRLLLGQAIDGRSSFQLSSGAIGYYSPATGLPIDPTPGTGVTWMWESLDQTSLRYPLGPVNTWLWKSTIGAPATRPTMPYQPYLNKAAFGLAAMKAVDPTVRVTLSATSPRPNAVAQAMTWNQTLIDTVGGEMDGLVTNVFYDSTLPQNYGIEAVEGFIDGLTNQVAAHNASHTNQLHVMVGEHGNSIVPAIGNTDPDFAMQWQGAVTMADFIGMLSQKPEIERAHSFIWGNGSAVWHPIRLDGYEANGLGQHRCRCCGFTIHRCPGYVRLCPVVCQAVVVVGLARRLRRPR